MHRAFSFPVTVERGRTKERLQASVAGLCELELRKQRQECLVIGALALAGPAAPHDPPRTDVECFSNWGQENLTLRRQLSALQSSPWGLMQALEQQLGELRIDPGSDSYDGAQGDTGDSRPSSGFYESSEGHSPKERSCSTEPMEAVSSWTYTNDRQKSVAEPLTSSTDHLLDFPAPRSTLPRSFSAPYPPLEGIVEEATAEDSWQWEPNGGSQAWYQEAVEPQVSEEDYQRALRVEGYILGLIQRHTLSPRPCQPRTSLNPDLPYCGAPGLGGLHKRTPSHTPEHRLPDPHANLSPNPQNQGWGCDLVEEEACGGEAPLLDEESYLVLPCPHSRPPSLAGGPPPAPLPSLNFSHDAGPFLLCCEPQSPRHSPLPNSAIPPTQNLVSAQYIPGQGCHAPLRSPRDYTPEQPKASRVITSPDQTNSKSRGLKKNHDERQGSKKSTSKTSRSQSENSLLSQRVLPERRYSTTERPQGKRSQAHHQGPGFGLQVGDGGNNGRRWCSNLELSQDEGEMQAAQGHRRPPRRARTGHACPHSHARGHLHQQHPHHHGQAERAPLCRGEEGYTGAAAGESESSMSEVYSPASSSLSSDSDESGGLVWPQQLPPRLAPSSSSSSSPPQASGNASAQPKAFVKIKASHALKKKILRFRSGSLKVMTTV